LALEGCFSWLHILQWRVAEMVGLFVCVGCREFWQELGSVIS
jgi:hypothetical protein